MNAYKPQCLRWRDNVDKHRIICPNPGTRRPIQALGLHCYSFVAKKRDTGESCVLKGIYYLKGGQFLIIYITR
jgi:hypothetical protein